MISDKIRPHHLERKALLYVRQSSAHQDAIERFIKQHNKTSKPFVWTAAALAIFEKLPKSLHLPFESLR